MNYGIIGWTPEMDTCATLGEPARLQPVRLARQRRIVQAVFNKNLQFALNVTKSLPNLGRPKEFEDDPSHYQIKPTQDIQPNRFDVSYGRAAGRGHHPQGARPVDITVNVVGQNGTRHRVAWQPAPAGERYNEVKGYYFERRRATIPATIGTRAIQAGDIVNVIVKAGGLQQEFRYRIEAALHATAGQPPRSACSSSPPRTTPASRRTSTRGTPPRRGTSRSTSPRSRPPATRWRPSTSTLRPPTAVRPTASAPADQVPDRSRRALALRRGQLLLG